nr:PREDICTED: TNF receptor-associated factor 1-like isoform X1 [Lepisosteus oculatus]
MLTQRFIQAMQEHQDSFSYDHTPMNTKVNDDEDKSGKKRCCPFQKLGCKFKGGRSKMKSHEASAFSCHVGLLLDDVVRLERQGTILGDWGRIEAGAEALRPQIRRLQDRLHCTEVTEEMQELSLAVHSLQIRLPDLDKQALALENELALTSMAIEKCQALVERSARQFDSNKQLLTALQDKVRQVEQGLNLCLSVRNFPKEVAHKGVFIWRIPLFHRRIQEAKDGTRPCLDSDDFYTNTYGYRLKARLYLNGNEQGKGTHLSLYLMILKGDFDSLLQWPFSEMVKISIINQGNKEDSVVYHLAPNSSLVQALKKPCEIGNVPFGLSCFMSLEELYRRRAELVHDNTLFAKIEI